MDKCQFINVEQKSDEWHALRLGKITGSAVDNLFGRPDTFAKYIAKKSAEIITETRCDQDNFSNPHIERGNLYEDDAINAYMALTGSVVHPIGFCLLNEYVGCSPDGLVNSDGLIEVKIFDTHTFFYHTLNISNKKIAGIDQSHFRQMQFNMYVTGRQYTDYVWYNPNYPENIDLFYIRVPLDHEIQEEIDNKVKIAIFEIQNNLIKFKNIGQNLG